MEYATLALVAALVLVVGLAVPQMTQRRQAVVQSREGDRFSADLRLLEVSPQATRPSCGSAPLLHTHMIEGVAMSSAPAPRRPRRLRANMTREDANALAALKSARAARISAQAAAAQRRLVTVIVAGAAFVLFMILAATTSFSVWWLVLPGFFLAGTLVSSRLAGIRNENDQRREQRQMKELQERVAANQFATSDTPIAEDVAVSAVEDAALAAVEQAVEKAESMLADAQTPTNEAVEPPVVEEETAVDVEETVARRSWKVPPSIAPTYARKGRISGREVHPDTDIVSIEKVASAHARPVEASQIPAAKSSFQLDLDAVLETRRAQ